MAYKNMSHFLISSQTGWTVAIPLPFHIIEMTPNFLIDTSIICIDASYEGLWYVGTLIFFCINNSTPE